MKRPELRCGTANRNVTVPVLEFEIKNRLENWNSYFLWPPDTSEKQAEIFNFIYTWKRNWTSRKVSRKIKCQDGRKNVIKPLRGTRNRCRLGLAKSNFLYRGTRLTPLLLTVGRCNVDKRVDFTTRQSYKVKVVMKIV